MHLRICSVMELLMDAFNGRSLQCLEKVDGMWLK
jgi:hypothetical protein